MEEIEETLEAIAGVFSYIGEAVIEDKCKQLVKLAGAVEKAANDAEVNSDELDRAKRELEQADAVQRLAAVAGLLDASAALERTPPAPLHDLRVGAASLAGSCQEYRKAADDMDKIQREKEKLGSRMAAARWWTRLWRSISSQGSAEREPLLANDPEARLQDKEIADSIGLLCQGNRQLEERGRGIVPKARRLLAAALADRVPCDDLRVATDALGHADDPSTLLNRVIDLGNAATAMEKGADTAPLIDLRERAAGLARACRELMQASRAMDRVKRAAAEQRERRLAGGAWWARLCCRPRRRRGEQREEGPEDGAAAAAAVQPVLDQGEEKRSGMFAFAIHGSLSMITYLGPETVAERVRKLSQCARWYFSIVLCLWWTLQAAGVPCSAYARSLGELRCAQIICRIGMLGVNLLVIFFLHLALDTQDEPLMWLFLIGALVIHIVCFVRACCRGDLSV